MKSLVITATALTAVAVGAPHPEATEMKSLSPVIYVEEVEPCIPFWTELGFQTVATVPEGDALGFAMLVNGGVTLMYQSRASQEKDLPGLLPAELTRSTFLYISVDDLDGVIEKLGDVEVVVPRRTTFYGAEEIWVRPPCGSVVGFAMETGQEG